MLAGYRSFLGSVFRTGMDNLWTTFLQACLGLDGSPGVEKNQQIAVGQPELGNRGWPENMVAQSSLETNQFTQEVQLCTR